MILCVNPNAAIDKTAIVSPFRLNAIHRPQEVLALPGGKGCNVARALRTLGDTPVVTGWVGGFAGQFIESGLQAEGIQTAFAHTAAESRTCLSILDRENNTLTELYEKGAPVTTADVDALLERFHGLVFNADAVVLSGSLPAGAPPDLYRQLAQIAGSARVPVMLDSSGAALRLGLEARPALIKPNETEFAELLGHAITGEDALVEASQHFSSQYGARVVVSLGADGVLAADGDACWKARPPQWDIVSAVGSGDCLLAGITYALALGQPFAEALRTGVAAGTANAFRLGAGVFTLEDYTRVRESVTVDALT